jgi:hypothetical protein
MKLPEAAQKAITDHDARIAAGVADALRFRCGMNYEQTYQKVNEWTGVDRDAWEELMYEADAMVY